ncbi:unnamed protein product [Lymnaea stagnalis]|uniref:tRNA-splicing endonuclease subunit Sen54 N-terminal domain-containing protein n=1 Tax=Lymnaea stagnalis TaxID=6523 RepID=A0AAV2H5M4_LYMST
MSFYDLVKDSVLSAQELFKYRLKRETSLPSRGGQKDFQPDGSWIQTKALEAFMQERTSILSEQRVEKLKNLIEGKWDINKRLVNVKKTGKFWTHMGFTDNLRNWLYPEEALFLMEANVLEVYYRDLPLSIQEAYFEFLGPDVSLEEYQVFSHLRRLGFVVLRHESHPVITPYERQINLDKYIKKSQRKERKGKALQKGRKIIQLNGNSQGNSKEPAISSEIINDAIFAQDNLIPAASESNGNVSNSLKKMDTEYNESNGVEESVSFQHPADSVERVNVQPENVSVNTFQKAEKRCTSTVDNKTEISPAKIPRIDNESISLEGNPENAVVSTCGGEFSKGSSENCNSFQSSTNSRFYHDLWADCLQVAAKIHSSSHSELEDTHALEVTAENTQQKQLTSNLETHRDNKASDSSNKVVEPTVPLPNIANRNAVWLVAPDSRLLPSSVELNEEEEESLMFDVEQYRLKYPLKPKNRQMEKEEEREARIASLNFSFAEWTQRRPLVTATNWKDYKQKLAERLREINATTPVDHYWEGDVTPLVRPSDADSYECILKKLSIIQTAEDESLVPEADCVVSVKISYDVHLPDSKFKKSMPGVPNHRVCVTKCNSQPPGLAEIQELWSRFKDDVPIHWAVVDSGEIAFYIFDNSYKSESWT